MELDVSSLVNWGYQAHFKPVYSFSQKDFTRIKKQQMQTNDFCPLKRFRARKKQPPSLFLVHWFLFCECFCACKFFSQNRLKMVLIASVNYTTKMLYLKNFLAPDFEQLKTPFGEFSWLTVRHATPLVTLFFIINMLLTGRHGMQVVIQWSTVSVTDFERTLFTLWRFFTLHLFLLVWRHP